MAKRSRSGMGGLAPGDAAADEAFGEIAARHVEMAEDAAEFAGGIEAGDRLAEGVQHALAFVMGGAALRVGDDGPDLAPEEGRLRDRDHRGRRPAEFRIVPGSAGLVPVGERTGKLRLAGAHLARVQVAVLEQSYREAIMMLGHAGQCDDSSARLELAAPILNLIASRPCTHA